MKIRRIFVLFVMLVLLLSVTNGQGLPLGEHTSQSMPHHFSDGPQFLDTLAEPTAQPTRMPEPDDVKSIVWNPDGSLIAVSGGFIGCREDEPKRYGILIVSAATGETVKELVGMTCPSSALDWSPDGNHLLSLNLIQSVVYIWDVAAGQLIRTFPTQAQGTLSAEWSPNGDKIATSHPGNYVTFWDPETGQNLGTPSLSGTSVAWNPDGSRVVTGYNQFAPLDIWDVITRQELVTLQGVTEVTHNVDWSADGSRIAAVEIEEKAYVWDAASGQLLLDLSIANVTDALLSPDGTRLGTASVNDVQVWDVSTGDLLRTYPTTEPVVTLAWSPDGTQLAFSGPSRMVHIVDVPEAEFNVTSTPVHAR